MKIRSPYFGCFINLYTVDKNDVLSCNSNRKRAEHNLKEVERFVSTKIHFYEALFCELLGLNKGFLTYYGVNSTNFNCIKNTIDKIVYYKHLKLRCTICRDKKENNWYRKQRRKNPLIFN